MDLKKKVVRMELDKLLHLFNEARDTKIGEMTKKIK